MIMIVSMDDKLNFAVVGLVSGSVLWNMYSLIFPSCTRSVLRVDISFEPDKSNIQ